VKNQNILEKNKRKEKDGPPPSPPRGRDFI
jgi:hypothetical protein